jgi:4-amino-4-deoxy-L-arabinose transferase-like glycosyltransferase
MSDRAEQTNRNVWKKRVLILMSVALLARIAAAVLIEQYVQNADRSFLVEGDANGYWILAQQIVSGKDYSIYTPPRRVLRMPGFPILLATSIKLFGDSVLAARIVLALVGTACCWLTYCLGNRLYSPQTGFWAAMFVAVNPLHIGGSVLILSETWFTFWMLVSLLGLHWLLASNRSTVAVDCVAGPCTWRLWLRSLLVGALIGITVLVRPGFLPWLAICCLANAVLLQRTVVVRALVCGGLFLGCMTMLLPWAARNATVTGHWVLTSLWSGPSLYDGLNPHATGASDMRFFDEENVLSHMTEFEMNEHYKSRAMEFARNNPGRAGGLAVRKLGMVLTAVPNFAERKGWAVSAVCVATWLFLVITCAMGLQSRQWTAVNLLIMLGPLLQFLLVHMVFVGSVRYRLPLEFPLAVLGAIGWQKLVQRRQNSV